MEVNEEEQVEIKEEDDSLKALSCIDRVRVFCCTIFSHCLSVSFCFPPCLMHLSPGPLVFLPSLKSTFLNSNMIWDQLEGMTKVEHRFVYLIFSKFLPDSQAVNQLFIHSVDHLVSQLFSKTVSHSVSQSV